MEEKINSNPKNERILVHICDSQIFCCFDTDRRGRGNCQTQYTKI